ncbi:thioredoxin domain-containing protein [Halodesulfurarchaeum sp. HSR-GB]|uniref:thioredoxin domain-containing protein n=1 Tax=Halodesulfurarchaeum sp. HSR-GB TaxID=3074077 RepID=UPI0028552FCB|nr:thioredoxin domain-containing protein [Halodesulfurarchaeum sp. HSR-GB]MDR5657749.1 thioredoxin domain-containing protein [Halodesulfurarchaeum sp. HSR-GB]
MDLSRRQLIALGSGIVVTGGIGYSLFNNDAPCDDSRESGPITIGQEDAPTVRVFSDYACPHCKSFVKEVGPSLKSAAENGDIFYRHFDFPLPVDDRWSRAIPNVGRYVYEMAGPVAFSKFESDVYDYQGDYSEQAVIDTALDVLGSASESDVRSVLEERSYCEEIDQEIATGEDHGVEGTPMVMVGSDWTYVEKPSFENIMAAISDR